MGPFFRLYHFGCKVNQSDGYHLADGLISCAWRPAGPKDLPEVIIVNTCAVTGRSEKKAIFLFRRLRRRYPAARLVAMGCMARAPHQPLRGVSEVDLVAVRPEELERALAGLSPPPGPRPGRVRAFVKIQDGCDRACTYCIVPRIRGKSWHRSREEAVKEVARLAAQGVKEITLVGIHLATYRYGLGTLLGELSGIPGVARFRLSSLDPGEVIGELVRELAGYPRLCPHFHLPLQSGSDTVLERMGRPYRRADFLRTVEGFRRAWDRPAISTDCLVGFPGETEEQYRETLEIIRSAGVIKAHVFPFSSRPGTPAASFFGRCPPAVLRERVKGAEETAGRVRDGYARTLIGMEDAVLVETVGAEGSAGYLPRYLRVKLPPSPGVKVGDLVAVKLDRWEEGIFRASLAKPPYLDYDL